MIPSIALIIVSCLLCCCSSLAQDSLRVIEVDVPAKIPASSSETVQLMDYSFANSYGQPYVGWYEPPTKEFNRVVFNFTVTSAGRQFDRLGVMFMNDTEVFRTSTAEPTESGIVWTYMKDMTPYLSLFKQPQKIIFDLGNLVNDQYTAPFNTTLTATFINDQRQSDAADLILSVSTGGNAINKTSVFLIPDNSPTALAPLVFPRNVEKAIFSVSATGQAAEEFWWANVLSSETLTFEDSSLYGFSPFREIQLYIDGSLAGVNWPFPVIFTGGVDPGFWRPLVGIETFDLREGEIDITPFLPILCDGNPHTFELRIAGIADDGQGNGIIAAGVGSNWVVTGKVFIWLNESGEPTTGSKPQLTDPQAPGVHVSSNITKAHDGRNKTLQYEVSVTRYLAVSSKVRTPSGDSLHFWNQRLNFQFSGNVTAGGGVQYTDHRLAGHERSSSGYSRSFSYPFQVTQSYFEDPVSGTVSINATLDRKKDVTVLGHPVFPTGLDDLTPRAAADADADAIGAYNHSLPWSLWRGSQLSTRQNGSASYTASPSDGYSTSFGSTEQHFEFAGLRARDGDKLRVRPAAIRTGGRGTTRASGEYGALLDQLAGRTRKTVLYQRHVLAIDGSVVEDIEQDVREHIGSRSVVDNRRTGSEEEEGQDEEEQEEEGQEEEGQEEEGQEEEGLGDELNRFALPPRGSRHL